MQISNKADCSVLWWKVLHSNARDVLPILDFVFLLFWWRHFELHAMFLLIFFSVSALDWLQMWPRLPLSSTILGAGEDGTIWRWDEVDHASAKNWSKCSCSAAIGILFRSGQHYGRSKLQPGCSEVRRMVVNWMLALLCFDCCNLGWLRCYIAPWTS